MASVSAHPPSPHTHTHTHTHTHARTRRAQAPTFNPVSHSSTFVPAPPPALHHGDTCTVLSLQTRRQRVLRPSSSSLCSSGSSGRAGMSWCGAAAECPRQQEKCGPPASAPMCHPCPCRTRTHVSARHGLPCAPFRRQRLQGPFGSTTTCCCTCWPGPGTSPLAVTSRVPWRTTSGAQGLGTTPICFRKGEGDVPLRSSHPLSLRAFVRTQLAGKMNGV